MPEILVRPAVSPDVEHLSKLDHNLRTNRVWQMHQQSEKDAIQTTFKESTLPRAMRLIYPHSPDTLIKRWKSYSILLVGCVDSKPISYISLDTFSAPTLAWVKDLVVDLIWRRKGIASTLLKAAGDWGVERGFHQLLLECSSKNYPGIMLSKKSGFEFSGFNDQYFMNNDIAIFFSKFV